MRNHGQLPTAQLCQNELAARKASVFDFARDELAAVTGCADLELKRDGLLVEQISAQELEAGAFHHRDSVSASLAPESAPASVSPPCRGWARPAGSWRSRGVRSPIFALGQGMAAVHRCHQLLVELRDALDVGIGRKVEHERELDLERPQCGKRLHMVAKARLERHPRVLRPKSAMARGRNSRSERLARQQAHMCRVASLAVPRFQIALAPGRPPGCGCNAGTVRQPRSGAPREAGARTAAFRVPPRCPADGDSQPMRRRADSRQPAESIQRGRPRRCIEESANGSWRAMRD